MKTAILNIGDELLIGQVLNSNAQWLSQNLIASGASVSHQLTVGDSVESIHRALAYLESQLRPNTQDRTPAAILISGGLGPTHDDLTLDALSSYYSIPLEMNLDWMKKVEGFFESRKRKMSENNRKQGLLLSQAQVIENDCGTAAGQQFTTPAKIEVFVMPGVPHELKSMMNRVVLPWVQSHSDRVILQKTIEVTGIGESAFAARCESFVQRLKDLHNKDQLPISMAFLPNSLVLRLRIQIESNRQDQHEHQALLDALICELQNIAGADYLGVSPISLEAEVIRILNQNGKTLATAESCTGGLLAQKLTSVPGASRVFRGSILAYQNQIKTDELGVSPDLIQQHGVVSQAVAEAMARNLQKRWSTDFAISTTGEMGPFDDPSFYGRAWVAIQCPDRLVSRELSLEKDRHRNQDRTAQAALDFLRRIF